MRVLDVLHELVVANFVTEMVWLPATAEVPAEVIARTLGSELEPSFDAKAPWKLVNALNAVDKDDRSVPIVDKAVSCA
jgi:hypothetical protein